MGIVSFNIGAMSSYCCMPRPIFIIMNWGLCLMRTGAGMRDT
jgi:hypothetical protein